MAFLLQPAAFIQDWDQKNISAQSGPSLGPADVAGAKFDSLQEPRTEAVYLTPLTVEHTGPRRLLVSLATALILVHHHQDQPPQDHDQYRC